MKPLPTFVAVFCAAVAASAQDSKPAADSRPTFDMRAPLEPYAVQLEWTMTAKGALSAEVGGNRRTMPVDETSTYRLLDEFVERTPTPNGNRMVFRRSVLESQLTKRPDGAADDGTAGVTCEYVDDGRSVDYSITSNTSVTKDLFKRVHEAAIFVGADFGLPRNMPVGTRVPFRSIGLLRTLIAFDGEVSKAEGWIQLDAVDEKTRRAQLSGLATCIEETDVAGSVASGTYEVKLKFEVDLATQLPVRVDVEGRMLAEGRDAPKSAIAGDVKFSGKLTVAPVKNAAAARNAKPTFRDVKRRTGGVSFSLPSCWMTNQTLKDGVAFFDARFKKDQPLIEVRRFEDAGDFSAPAYLASFSDTIRQSAPDAKAERASVGGNKGISYSFSLDGGARLGRGYVVPAGAGAVVRVQLIGVPDAVKKTESDLRKAAGSVKAGG